MRLLTTVLAFTLVAALISCDVGSSSKTAEEKQSETTKQLLDQVNNKLGMPNIKTFQQKKLMKMIYELCDREDLLCYAYLQSALSGKLIFVGRCYGFGVPFSAQYTNPQVVEKGGFGEGRWGTAIPQADPNGLYMPSSSSATWLMMVDPETKEARPVYFEPTITVSPFALPTE
jgi:hypothetical protein